MEPPCPHEGCSGVEGKVLVKEDDLVAMLRFEPGDPRAPGANDTIVVCLEGEGRTSVARESAPLRAGEQARYERRTASPVERGHPMVTLMIERTG